MKKSSRQITTILMVTLMVWTAITAFLPEVSMFSFAVEEKSGAEATAPTPTETASKKTSKPLIRNKWKIVDGKWCYYNNKGVVKKRVSKSIKRKWVTAAGKKFYFSKNSKPVGQGFHMIKGKLYYMGKDRALVKGKFKYKGDKYRTTKAGNITGIPYYRYKYSDTTFVLIDISEQRMWIYKKDKLKLKAPVVTGNIRRGWDTPTGKFKVRHKATCTYLSGTYYVRYWVAFIRNEYGMHDARWRSDSDFNNPKAYKTRGSHGCINMRRKDARKMYYLVSYGNPVIVQN